MTISYSTGCMLNCLSIKGKQLECMAACIEAERENSKNINNVIGTQVSYLCTNYCLNESMAACSFDISLFELGLQVDLCFSLVPHLPHFIFTE